MPKLIKLSSLCLLAGGLFLWNCKSNSTIENLEQDRSIMQVEGDSLRINYYVNSAIEGVPIPTRDYCSIKNSNYCESILAKGFDWLVPISLTNVSSLNFRTRTVDSVIIVSSNSIHYRDSTWETKMVNYTVPFQSQEAKIVLPNSKMLFYLPVKSRADTLIIDAGNLRREDKNLKELRLIVVFNKGLPSEINTLAIDY